MDSRTFRPPPGGAGFGLGGPVPRDVWVLLGVIFGTFTLQFFAWTAIVPALLRLGPAVWQTGFVWQLVTYPIAGTGAPSFWFLLELLILLMFGRDVWFQLGRRRFWRTLATSALAASLVAVALEIVTGWLFGRPPGPGAFGLMQGQHMSLVILIAAFATLNRNATILLFFVLPIRAGWFLGLEILFAFMGFLASKDLAGFVGITAAVGFTYWRLSSSGGRWWREPWLRLQQTWIRYRLARMRRRSGLKVVRGGPGPGRGEPWIHREFSTPRGCF